MNVPASMGRAIRRTNIWNLFPSVTSAEAYPVSARTTLPCDRSEKCRSPPGQAGAVVSVAGLGGAGAEDVVDRELGRQAGQVVGERSATVGDPDAATDDQRDAHGDQDPSGDDHG